MKFQHAPLAHHRDIRLVQLVLKPIRGIEPTVVCEFSHHSIDQSPSYSTLSYTWTNLDLEKGETAIYAAGSASYIQPNLAAWIETHGIRLASQGHRFWIDQLCIDQSNISERSYQVRLMKEIYTQSSKLFVWLGPGSEESTLALETMDRAGHVFMTFGAIQIVAISPPKITTLEAFRSRTQQHGAQSIAYSRNPTSGVCGCSRRL